MINTTRLSWGGRAAFFFMLLLSSFLPRIFFSMIRYTFLILSFIQICFPQVLRFERIGMNEGLPQSTVSEIFQDREGFLWFGTWDGLVRYDGFTFLTFRNVPNDSTTLSNNNIRKIVQDSSGYLWVSTQNGLNRFHPRTGRVQQFLPDTGNPSMINSRFIFSIMQGMNGDLYFGTTNGLTIYDTATGHFRNLTFSSINTSRGPTLSIVGVHQESSHVLWLGSFDGLLHYDLKSGTYTAYPYKDEKGNPIGVNQPTADRNGLLWCTAANNRVVVFDPVKRIFLEVKHERKHFTSEDVLQSFFPENDGSMWIVAYEQLIHINAVHRTTETSLTVDSVQFFRHDPADNSSLNATSLMSFWRDRSGVIWVGTSSGLNKAVPQRKKFNTYDTQFFKRSGIGSHELVCFLRNGNDSLWIGTREGIYLLGKRNGVYRLIGRNFSIPKTTILSMLHLPDGRMLAGTRDGFYVWNERRRSFERKHPYPSNENTLWRIFTMVWHDGALWIGTNDGLYRSDDPELERFEQVHFDPSTRKTFMILRLVKSERPNELLICTNNDGLYRYRTDSKHSSGPLKQVKGDTTSLSHSIIMDAVERNGSLWAATYGGGLNRIIRSPLGTFNITHYRESNGLINDNLYCVIPDRHGYLWMSSNKGLSRFDPTTERFLNFTEHDGLPANEFNHNAFLAESSGVMLFGGISGFVEFDPAEIVLNSIVPPIVITDLRIFEQPRNDLLQSREITLKYDENYLSFEFSSLSYDAPKKNQYAYRMIGVNERWTLTDLRRYATFTNLSPGEYLFQVKGSNNDGLWNEAGVSLRISILPPWWGTLWFRIGMFLIFVGAVAGGAWSVSRRRFQRRFEELKKQQELMEERHRTRQQIARDLHDDVASTISSISLYSDMVHRKRTVRKEELADAVKRISMLSSGAKQAMEEVVWSLSPKHDTLEQLVNRIGDTAVQRFGDAAIECRLAFCVIPPEIMIDDLLRKNIYLIFKEAMNNIVKHSQATSVELTSWFENGCLFLSVRDNGCGIRQEKRTPKSIGGNGLTNMQERAKSIGAELTVTSAKNEGTTVAVKIEITQMRH